MLEAWLTSPVAVGIFAVICAAVLYFYFSGAVSSTKQKEITSTNIKKNDEKGDTQRKATTNRRVLVVFASESGTTRTCAHKLFSHLLSLGVWDNFTTIDDGKVTPADLVNVEAIQNINIENLVDEEVIVVLLPTYAGGRPPPSAASFVSQLEDMATDFRYPSTHLQRQQLIVWGIGDRAYGEDMFCKCARHVESLFKQLGIQVVLPTQLLATGKKFQLEVAKAKNATGTAVSKVMLRGEREEDDDAEAPAAALEAGEEDIEDIVDSAGSTLVYPLLRKNLEKQGYRIIGSHSAVKVCRWTKSMLRGRGGCYKHTFYNISSHRCMEMTPSLACANKCVFCWRHHTNPVARSFEWEQDPPEFLIENAIEGHRSMIKQLKGVPGVDPARFEEGMNPAHCALSLVGEPIMYPQISKFCELLHRRRISTFMVTNSQFPEQLQSLGPVTQLYLSIDAPTPEELKAIDRPIFEDYWERSLECIRCLAGKRQRTVFRLTLVKGLNVGHLTEYIKLIRLGQPDFIEVKGVTFCGDSNTSSMTLSNVPYHQEVVSFCQSLAAAFLPGEEAQEGQGTTPGTTVNRDGYNIACEHEHSCCILMAKNSFWCPNAKRWKVWIDYDRFFELVNSGKRDFTSLDYSCAAPAWAHFQSNERGFDPTMERVYTKGSKKGKGIPGGTDSDLQSAGK